MPFSAQNTQTHALFLLLTWVHRITWKVYLSLSPHPTSPFPPPYGAAVQLKLIEFHKAPS